MRTADAGRVDQLQVLRPGEERPGRAPDAALAAGPRGRGPGRAEFDVYPLPSGRHARMFHSDLAFCGAVLRGKEAKGARKGKRAWVFYQDARWEELCGKCREKIEELMAEAREAEAMKQA